MPREMREARLTVGDYASPGRGDAPNPCVMGCAHLFLGSLFVLGQGEGGAEGGRVESRLAVSAVLANFRSSEVSDPRRRLVEALEHAGEVLHMRSRSGPAFNDSWARCVAVLVRRGRLFAARVGDIRLGMVREGTATHLFGPTGEVPRRPVLGQAHALNVEVLDEPVALRGGDRVIISNAYLYSAVPHDELARVVTSLVPAVAARRLVEAADRSSDAEPVSVQVVQIGDSTVMDEVAASKPQGRGADSVVSRAPVAPVRMASRPSAVPPQSSASSLGPRRVGASPNMEPPGRELPWAFIVAGLLFIGAGAFFVPRLWGSQDAAPVDWASEGSRAEIVANTSASDESPTTDFWSHVSRRLGESGKVLDPTEVRRWLDSPEERARRLREARAVIAVLGSEAAPFDREAIEADLPEVVDGNEDLGSPPGEPLVAPEGAGGAGGEPTPTSDPILPEPASDGAADSGTDGTPADDPAAPSDADVTPGPWDPSTLSPGLRGYEKLFATAPVGAAASTLKGYIHRRHARLDRVFTGLDKYLEVAPRERSLSVLVAMLELRPGPRTTRWARKHVRQLRRDLGITVSRP